MTGPMCRAIGGRGDVIGMAFGAVGEASSSVLVHAKACAEVISKEAMSEGDVDAVTKDTGYGRVLGEIIRAHEAGAADGVAPFDYCPQLLFRNLWCLAHHRSKPNAARSRPRRSSWSWGTK